MSSNIPRSVNALVDASSRAKRSNGREKYPIPKFGLVLGVLSDLGGVDGRDSVIINRNTEACYSIQGLQPPKPQSSQCHKNVLRDRGRRRQLRAF